LQLLNEKEQKWLELKKEAKERIEELAEVFSGNKPLTSVERNENLSQWLKTKATQIDSLDFQKLNFSGRKIIELIRALNDMLGKLASILFMSDTLRFYIFGRVSQFGEPSASERLDYTDDWVPSSYAQDRLCK
jgi:hypothetical protein